jgi:hypothetical protein
VDAAHHAQLRPDAPKRDPTTDECPSLPKPQTKEANGCKGSDPLVANKRDDPKRVPTPTMARAQTGT